MQKLNVLAQPVISEKSYKDAQDGVFTFIVDRGANKIEIASAVEMKFKVSVVAVRTVRVRGKRVTNFKTGRKQSRRQSYKKAFVTLKEGDKIALFDV